MVWTVLFIFSAASNLEFDIWTSKNLGEKKKTWKLLGYDFIFLKKVFFLFFTEKKKGQSITENCSVRAHWPYTQSKVIESVRHATTKRPKCHRREGFFLTQSLVLFPEDYYYTLSNFLMESHYQEYKKHSLTWGWWVGCCCWATGWRMVVHIGWTTGQPSEADATTQIGRSGPPVHDAVLMNSVVVVLLDCIHSSLESGRTPVPGPVVGPTGHWPVACTHSPCSSWLFDGHDPSSTFR